MSDLLPGVHIVVTRRLVGWSVVVDGRSVAWFLRAKWADDMATRVARYLSEC